MDGVNVFNSFFNIQTFEFQEERINALEGRKIIDVEAN